MFRTWSGAAPSAQESHWGYGKIKTARLGAQCLQWILTRGKEHDIRLVQTRNYVPHQAAFYAEWLLFREDESSLAIPDCIPAISDAEPGFNSYSVTGRLSQHAWRRGCNGVGSTLGSIHPSNAGQSPNGSLSWMTS